jgi:tRNA(Met) cytidine acetyltransferase
LEITAQTADQESVVAGVRRVVEGHRRRPLVVTADRGRGKSAALGMAAAALLQSGRCETIAVTAPNRGCVEAVFEHARKVLEAAARLVRARPDSLRTSTGELRFLAPERLTEERLSADLVLVDEAAALPVGLLKRLLKRCSRIVFSTTVHGYEGSGRGFAVKFSTALDELAPGWCGVEMNQPVRWSPNDPLEAFLFRSLLLDAEPAPVKAGANWEIHELSRHALATDEALLKQVFGLLVTAHYRTTPMDLRHLLDGPNLRCWVAMSDVVVIGVLLVAEEGGFPEGLANDIIEGRRRPRGHLLPQTLAYHLGLRDALKSRGFRVVRIAVHPDRRREGVGHDLLANMKAYATDDRQGFVGAVFAASQPMLAFWRKAGMEPVRVGVRKETSSGAHALVVLGAPVEGKAGIVMDARARFTSDFPYQLGDALRDLDPDLAWALLSVLREPATKPDAADIDVLKSFSHGGRAFDSARPALFRALVRCGERTGSWRNLKRNEAVALIVRVLQSRPWDEAANLAGVSGRRELIDLLRRSVGKLFQGRLF